MSHESHEQDLEKDAKRNWRSVSIKFRGKRGVSQTSNHQGVQLVIVFTHRAIGRTSWEVLGASKVFHEGITVRARLFWVAK